MSRKPVAVGLAAVSLLQSIPMQGQPDWLGTPSGLHLQPPDVRQNMLGKATRLLGMYVRDDPISIDDLPEAAARRKLAELSGDAAGAAEAHLYELASRFDAGTRDYGWELRKWANLLTKSAVESYNSTTQRQGYALEDVGSQLMAIVVDDALEHPAKGIDALVQNALQKTGTWDAPQLHIRDWSSYPWGSYWKIEAHPAMPKRDNLDRQWNDSLAYLLIHADDALRTFQRFAASPDYLLATDVRTATLYDIRRVVHNAREMREDILNAAKQHGLPAGELGYLVGNFFEPVQASATLDAPRSERERERPTAEATLRAMSLAAVLQLKDLYASGIGKFIVVDRGANPFGKILETIIGELDLPPLDIRYFKFLGSDKLVERYAQTPGFRSPLPRLSTAEAQAVLHEAASLRATEKSLRQQEDAGAANLRDELAALVQVNRDLYDAVYSLALQEQVRHARNALGDLRGRKLRVYDDLISTGQTMMNVADVVGALGGTFSRDDMLPLVDSKANAGRAAIIRDLLAFSDDAERTSAWMDTLPWRAMADINGIRYGIDDPASARLFDRRQAYHAYRLCPPAHDFYSTGERVRIARGFLRSALIVEPGCRPDAYAVDVAAQALSCLRAYNVTERTLDAVEQRLNALRNRAFRSHLRRTTVDAIRSAQARTGASMRAYVLGEETRGAGLLEQHLRGTAASLLRAT